MMGMGRGVLLLLINAGRCGLTELSSSETPRAALLPCMLGRKITSFVRPDTAKEKEWQRPCWGK